MFFKKPTSVKRPANETVLKPITPNKKISDITNRLTAGTISSGLKSKNDPPKP